MVCCLLCGGGRANAKYQVVLTKTDLVDPTELGKRAQMVHDVRRPCICVCDTVSMACSYSCSVWT